jgi:hypothetical protein
VSQQCHITINNRSSEHLRLQSKDLQAGDFEQGPLADIKPHDEAKAFIASGTTGVKGTEGTVVYQLGDDANTTISIYWDVPQWSMSNRLDVKSSDPDVATKVDGFAGKGSTEACNIRVLDAREAHVA